MQLSSRSTGAQALALLLFVAVTLVAAAIGALASVHARSFYMQLDLPLWAPPASLFGPVWSVLYVLMALSGWLFWRRARGARLRQGLLAFGAQLAANALWSWLFFVWHWGAEATALAALLAVLVAWTAAVFCRACRLAAVLLLPYLAWVSFATVLAGTIWWRNPALL
ncbi:tryptophan-rich sensory protein [Lampropedia cohaerens]|uniref:Tryptophan-rich sensory protein n=1 Tax=Lampropedia cohaerens TaxID=1610491 RepID=A0A0U1Q0U6_9BURK|nr:TspO/MBR family protein [Lampropedia cohaerens]KKW68366.1 tryptophan-rich sensory protein [Lampropedia cohaerens]